MDPSESKKKRIVALIMYICFGLTGMLSVSVGALIPFIRTYKEGVGYGEAGLIVSIYAIGNLLANIGYCGPIHHKRIMGDGPYRETGSGISVKKDG